MKIVLFTFISFSDQHLFLRAISELSCSALNLAVPTTVYLRTSQRWRSKGQWGQGGSLCICCCLVFWRDYENTVTVLAFVCLLEVSNPPKNETWRLTMSQPFFVIGRLWIDQPAEKTAFWRCRDERAWRLKVAHTLGKWSEFLQAVAIPVVRYNWYQYIWGPVHYYLLSRVKVQVSGVSLPLSRLSFQGSWESYF